MYQGKTLKLDSIGDGLVELQFNAESGSVNVFNARTVSELGEALDVLEASKSIAGLLVTSGKKGFIAGADITEFERAFSGDKQYVRGFLHPNNVNFNRLEDLAFPTVAAINGFALGGGFELCLACDYRVAESGARLGFPEVGLGILPGWGGTVRAPRLAGFENGGGWVLSGRPEKAGKALEVGLVDAVAEAGDARAEALKLLNDIVAGNGDYQRKRTPKLAPMPAEGLEEAQAALEKAIAGKSPDHHPAPHKALEAMVKGAPLDRDGALEVEFDAFYELSQTPQCRALVGMFLADQYLASVARDYAGRAQKSVERMAVLGAGTMGGGIAFQNALKGIPVLMKDINEKSLELGMDEARQLLGKRVKRGALKEADAEKVLARITPSLEYGAIADCDVIIEAVVENEKVKKNVLSEVEALVPDTTVLASNTSSILIGDLAGALKRPENFCGMHFFNPVHAMPLVEVVKGPATGEATVATAVSQALAMGKKPIVVKDCPGFLVNRTLFPYFAGFNLLIRDGADFRQIDRVMEEWGWPMGPAYLLDVIGIDVAVHAADVVARGFPDRLELDFKSAMQLMHDEQRFGQKNGVGFYRYDRDENGRHQRRDDAETDRLLDSIRSPVREFDRDEIVARMMIPMATEMARCLDEQVVASPREADVALIYGLGFPSFRGGVFRWMDEVGLERFCDLADGLSQLGKLYEPTESMRRMASEGKNYHSR
jgi:3-hydroxyacyl-CoA dehydrogenase/enoyl-CoA hydratase/3-hydroxybutyryl-CoA epimerase/enoyl-CoA isomerase